MHASRYYALVAMLRPSLARPALPAYQRAAHCLHFQATRWRDLEVEGAEGLLRDCDIVPETSASARKIAGQRM